MIMSGVVEISTRLAGPNAGANSVLGEEEQSFSVDMDESFTLDCNQLSPAGLDIKDGKLHIDRHKVWEVGGNYTFTSFGRWMVDVDQLLVPLFELACIGTEKRMSSRMTILWLRVASHGVTLLVSA
jgi:hypothetical protein